MENNKKLKKKTKSDDDYPWWKTIKFIEKYFPKIKLQDWNNWEWQIKNSITNYKQLEKYIKLTSRELNFFKKTNFQMPVRITPYYLSLINNKKSVLRKCMVPNSWELKTSFGEQEDPLNEDNCSPIEWIVHRYPDRVLFLVTGFCSANCRYCTRSRIIAQKTNKMIMKKQWLKSIEYIKSHNEIRDVLISWGDPLTLSDKQINWLLSKLSKIKHVEIIRIWTKVPVVLPQRITPELLSILKKYHPLWMSIHFTHWDEITRECKKACNNLANAWIPLWSQTVLLKNINDNIETMKDLVHKLVKVRVRPYYLYQCDPILWSWEFRTDVNIWINIIKWLRWHTSWYCIPHYVIDAPWWWWKIPILPQYYQWENENYHILKNYENKEFYYPKII